MREAVVGCLLALLAACVLEHLHLPKQSIPLSGTLLNERLRGKSYVGTEWGAAAAALRRALERGDVRGAGFEAKYRSEVVAAVQGGWLADGQRCTRKACGVGGECAGPAVQRWRCASATHKLREGPLTVTVRVRDGGCSRTVRERIWALRPSNVARELLRFIGPAELWPTTEERIFAACVSAAERRTAREHAEVKASRVAKEKEGGVVERSFPGAGLLFVGGGKATA